MRGSPFTFSSFEQGINTYDSPYSIKQGEARDCLNVVSSPRGAIQKRTGSTSFGTTVVFPAGLGVTDNFNRTENPLKNGAKWSALGGTVFQNTSLGETNGTQWVPSEAPVLLDDFTREENPLNNGGKWTEWFGAVVRGKTTVANGWAATTVFATGFDGAYWNPTSYSSQCIVAEISHLPVNENRNVGLRACFSNPGTAERTGYAAFFARVADGTYTLTLSRYPTGNPPVTIGTATGLELKVGDWVALEVRSGWIRVWRTKNEGKTGVWYNSLEIANTLFTSGKLGVTAEGSGEFGLKNLEVLPQPTGGRWNVAEQTNPATSIVASKFADGGLLGLLTCVDANTENGYFAYLTKSNGSACYVTIVRIAANVQTVLSTTAQTFAEGDSFGVTVRKGIVTAWRKTGGIWVKLVEISDSTYTKGYSGVWYLSGKGQALTKVDDFSVGEAAEAGTEREYTSLAAVHPGSSAYLLAASGTELFSIDNAGTVTSIKTGMTSGKKWSVVQCPKTEAGFRVEGQGPVFMSNGTDPPQYWTGAAKNTETKEWTSNPSKEKEAGGFNKVPKAQYLVYKSNRIFAAGMSTDESAVQFTGIALVKSIEYPDPTNWPAENIVWFAKDDGTPITALGTVNAYVLVFKQHKTWVIYNPDAGENRQISDTIGCISHRSVVETHLGTFFLTPDQGVFLTNGSTMKEVSRNVKTILKGQDPNPARNADVTQLENASAGYLNGHYYLSYAAQDGTYKTLDYDTTLNSWWIHDLAGNQWAAWEPTTGTASLYAAPHKATGNIVKAFVPGVYTDSGSNYTGAHGFTAFWFSSWEPFWQYFMRHRFQQPQVRKRIRQVFVDGKGELITVVFRKFGTTAEELKGVVDTADQQTLTTAVTLGSESSEYQPVRYYALGTSRIWSFGFGNKTGQPFEVDSYAADLSFRKS